MVQYWKWMMKNKKLFAAILLVSVLLSCMTGCNGKTDRFSNVDMPETVQPLESGEAGMPETVQPFDPNADELYSPDGQSALIEEDNGTYQVKRLYQVSAPKESMEETRWCSLQKKTGQLEIWDDLEKQSIFKGTVRLDEDGVLVNKKYYDKLLWDDLYRISDYREETSIVAWRDGDLSEGQACVGNYENPEDFLSEAGFQNNAPVYEYYDRFHNLRLELYSDDSKERFCGIVYRYYFNSDRKKCMEGYGFTIDRVEVREWEKDTAFSIKSVTGSDGSNAVEEFEEIIEYTRNGMMDSYKSRGLMERRRDEDGELELAPVTVLELDYVYRDDGTLYYRDYTHNPYIFGSTLGTLESYYDESGRVVYESGYITHGELENYYIYSDTREKPKYRLVVDYGGGYATADMVRYL